MKPVWLWIIFLLVYGLLSMKIHAAEIPAEHTVLTGHDARLNLPAQGS